MKTQVATDFLQNLKPGDKVLVCHEDGEIYTSAEIINNYGSDKRLRVRGERISPFGNAQYFSKSNGKQWGDDMFLQPHDEARYQAHVAEIAKWREEGEQRQKARDAEKRVGLKTAILSVVDMIDSKNLDGLSTSDLRALMTILNKLGGE